MKYAVGILGCEVKSNLFNFKPCDQQMRMVTTDLGQVFNCLRVMVMAS
jgi:hypothetical protein